jgi:hypothetical protein
LLCCRPRLRHPHPQEYVEHRERCWWQWRNRKLQDEKLMHTLGTDKVGKILNFRTDFSARESYEQQDSATGQRPNVGSVCVSIVQHSPTMRRVSTYTKEVINEEDAKGFARKVVTYAKGVNTLEDKVVLRTDVHYGYARNKGNARFHHTFHQDIFAMYKTGKVKHAFAAWHDGKVLPGCKNYAHEEGEKLTEENFSPLLPDLEEALGFTDGAIPQYQQKETVHGTARCFADLGVRMSHDIHEKYDFKGPWDNYGKLSTESRHSAVRNRSAVINNAYLHAKHNAMAMAGPKQVCAPRFTFALPLVFVLTLAHSRSRSPLTQEKSEARWRDYAADHYFHYYYRYGEDEKGTPLDEGHRNDDLLELSAAPVKDLMTYKHYEGGRTLHGVGAETGFTFTRRRIGCYCVPAAGASCCHRGWTGDLDRGAVVPVRPTQAGGSGAPQQPRRSGPSDSFRQSIGISTHLLSMPGDEDDETADGESIWFVNALGPQEKNKETVQCGPCKLVKNHFSVPVEWLNLVELTDEYAIFAIWPTEQDRIAVTHLMGIPDLVWDKEEDGMYYMKRAQYDMCNEQL